MLVAFQAIHLQSSSLVVNRCLYCPSVASAQIASNVGPMAELDAFLRHNGLAMRDASHLGQFWSGMNSIRFLGNWKYDNIEPTSLVRRISILVTTFLEFWRAHPDSTRHGRKSTKFGARTGVEPNGQ